MDCILPEGIHSSRPIEGGLILLDLIGNGVKEKDLELSEQLFI